MSAAPHAVRRPYWLVLLAAAASAANLIGLTGRLAGLPRDTALALPLSPWIGVALTAFWALVFAGLALALFRRGTVRAAIVWAAPLFTMYALVGLFLLSVFARADYDRGRIGAEAAASALALVPLWWRWWRERHSLRSATRAGEGAA